MPRSRVFLTHRMTQGSLCNLNTYGELAYLFYDTNTLNDSIWDDNLQKDIEARIISLSFNSEVDFFAASGIMTLSHITLATLIQKFGTVNCLMFDRDQKLYRLKKVGG